MTPMTSLGSSPPQGPMTSFRAGISKDMPAGIVEEPFIRDGVMLSCQPGDCQASGLNSRQMDSVKQCKRAGDEKEPRSRLIQADNRSQTNDLDLKQIYVIKRCPLGSGPDVSLVRWELT